MFTPPPSPAPFPQASFLPHEPPSPASLDTSPASSRSPSPHLLVPGSLLAHPPRRPTLAPCPATPPVLNTPLTPTPLTPAQKKRVGARRTFLSLLLVPAILVLITLTTRVLSHPAALDALSADASPDGWALTWRAHKRHPSPDADTPASSSSAGSGASSAIAFPTTLAASSAAPSAAAAPTTTGASGALPTVPSTPPVLPTPFPQALDTTLGNNFSSQACTNFFLNMTQTSPFRACRPFGLLLGSSSAFLQAQTNATLMNALLWGTCNTSLDAATCASNMDWFASALQSSCATELAQRNAVAADTLTGLRSYALMRAAGCLAAPTTNTYCYLSSVAGAAASAADAGVFSLPLGDAMPAAAPPSCGACTRSLMAAFASALSGDSAGTAAANTSAAASGVGDRYAALKDVYSDAAKIVSNKCGGDFVQNAGTSAAGPGVRPALPVLGAALLLAVVAAVGW